MADKPTMRDMVSDGASVRRIRQYIRDRLGQPERGVWIEYGGLRFGQPESLWRAALGRTSDCVGGPIGQPHATLAGLLDSIVTDLDEREARRREREQQQPVEAAPTEDGAAASYDMSDLIVDGVCEWSMEDMLVVGTQRSYLIASEQAEERPILTVRYFDAPEGDLPQGAVTIPKDVYWLRFEFQSGPTWEPPKNREGVVMRLKFQELPEEGPVDGPFKNVEVTLLDFQRYPIWYKGVQKFWLSDVGLRPGKSYRYFLERAIEHHGDNFAGDYVTSGIRLCFTKDEQVTPPCAHRGGSV